MVVAYIKLNFTNISVLNAKKIEFYSIHIQDDNQKTLAYKDDILDLSRPI